MSRYSQYGGYYDPVGSQNSKPTGYTYQPLTTPAASSAYTSNYQYGGNTYGTQQFGSKAIQQASDSADHAAAALSSMSGQNYGQTSTTSRPSASRQYDNSTWYNNGSSAQSASYNGNATSVSNRAQNPSSSLYQNTSQSSSSYDRLSVPQQAQSSSSTYGANTSYQSAQYATGTSSTENAYPQPHQQPSQQPPRYNSPLQAVQAQQQGHARQSSRNSNQHQPSAQITHSSRSAEQAATNRQQSSSVEPSPMTVDPSQIYDNRAELQRKAQIEAERRRKVEAEQAAKKAEEERIDAEKRRAEEEKEKAKREAAEKAERDKKKKEQQRKAREEKKRSKNAATALQTMAAIPTDAASSTDEGAEAEMREMFKKMREFNQKNPEMLARLWEEERKTHSQTQSTPAASSPKAPALPVTATAEPSTQPPKATKPDKAKETAGKKSAEPANATTSVSTATPSQQAPPAAAPKPSGPMTLWPPHKKVHLAEATASWLRTQPQNANTTVTSQTILGFLEHNPSYVQLCESFERLGLKFERSALARELLRLVPDELKAQPGIKPGTPRMSIGPSYGTSSAAQKSTAAPAKSPLTVAYEAPLSLSQAAREVNSMDQVTSPVPGVYGGPAQIAISAHSGRSVADRVASQSQPPETKPEVKVEEPARPPADKEEAARKRTFGDLVDLTAEVSDEEPPPKRMATSPPNAANDNVPPRGLSRPELPQDANDVGVTEAPRSSLYEFAPRDRPTSFWGTYHQPQDLPRPPVVGSNAPSVSQIPPPPKPRGPTRENMQQLRVRGKMLVEPIMRDRVARKSRYNSNTIARDVLLATGRHPDMRGLNAHLAPMQKLLGHHGGDIGGGSGAEGGGGDTRNNRSDLATIRWDIIDPEPTKDAEAKLGDGARGEVEGAKQREDVNGTAELRDAASPAEGGSGIKKRKRRRFKYYPGDGVTGSSTLTNGNLGDAGHTSSRATTPAGQRTSTSTPSAGANGTMLTGTPVGYAAFRKIGEDGTVIKTKGRPVGWRKNIHSREAQGLAPKTSLPSRARQKQPGTTAAASSSTVSTTPRQVEPQWAIYKCAWEGCKAELHNLETLKKHVVKIHGSPSDDEDKYECWWRGCPVSNGDQPKPKKFDGIEGWIGHVDLRHLAPISWKLGDGPKADLSAFRYDAGSDNTPPYLLDREGRSTTPIVLPRSEASGQVKPLGRGRPPKDGTTAEKRDMKPIDAPLRDLMNHKRVVGPTMDRMGCVLADEERRRGFLADEDFEDEVSGSEHDTLDQ